MLVRTYATKNELSVDDILEALTQCGDQNWKITTKLTASQINFLNQTFSIGLAQLPPSNIQAQLPASNHTQSQLPASNDTVKTDNQSEVLATREPSDLAKSLTDNKDNLATQDVQVLKTNIKTKVVKESAQIAAITDYQTYQDTYEETTRDLVINEVFTHLERQSSIREEFKSSQMVRQQTHAKPESKDLTTELLELWGDDHNDFVNDLLKNIKGVN